MIVGTITAITQTDVKRMLAYSAVAHAGFILTGVIGGGHTGPSGTLFYLFAYGFSTVGAFAVVSVVRDATGAKRLTWPDGRAGATLSTLSALSSLVSACIRGHSSHQRLLSAKFAVFICGGPGRAIPSGDRRVSASAVAAYSTSG